MVKLPRFIVTMGLSFGMLSHPSSACADAVVYLGESFSVDTLATVQPDQVTVTLAGSSFLVSRENVAKRVALAYAADARLAKSMPWAKYIGFLGKVKAPEDSDLVEAAARMFFVAGDLSLKERNDLAEVLTHIDPKANARINALQSSGSSSIDDSVCLAIRYLDDKQRAVVRERAPDVLLRYKTACSEFFRNGARTFASAGSLREAVRDLDVTLEVFALAPELDLPIVTARHRLTELQRALASRDAFTYRSAFDEAARDPFLLDAFKVGHNAIVQAAASVFVDERLSGGALSILTLVDFARRTEVTHDLVLKSLSELRGKEVEVLKQERIRRSLLEFALKDEGIKVKLLALFESLIQEHRTSGDQSFAISLFDAIREARPDPSPENDNLRFLWASQMLDEGQVGKARTIIENTSTSAPIMLRLKLLLREQAVIILISVVALGGALVAILFLRRRSLAQITRQESAAQQNVEETDVEREEEGSEPVRQARFVRYSPDLRGGGIRDEYEDLLAVFGMRPGVKLSHIKNSYRNAVKSCHPDLNRNASSAEAERFIYLTQNYERLLRVHEERTGER